VCPPTETKTPSALKEKRPPPKKKDSDLFLFRKWLWQKEKYLNDVIITVLIVRDQLSPLIDEMPVILAPLFSFLKNKTFQRQHTHRQHRAQSLHDKLRYQ
jgi:hypothetical protein